MALPITIGLLAIVKKTYIAGMPVNLMLLRALTAITNSSGSSLTKDSYIIGGNPIKEIKQKIVK
jgi:hypothetical protein